MRKNFLRTFIAAVLICSMLVIPAYAEEATVSGSDVNVRSGPGVNYPVVICLSRNTPITVTDRSNGDWYAINYNGTTGFMSSRYISMADSGSSGQIVVDTGNASQGTDGYINAMYVRFRSGPNSSSSILGEYNTGKQVQIIGSSNGWTQCIINGQAGYIYSPYISTGSYSGSNNSYVDSGSSNTGSSDGVIIIGGETPSQPVQTPPPVVSTPAPVATPAPVVQPDDDDSVTIIIGGSEPSPTPTPVATPVPTPAPTATPTPVVTPEVTPSEEKTGAISGNYVRFRSGPGTSYSILGTYNIGTELRAIGTSGDWTKCIINNQEGYVFTSYVKLNASSTGSNDAVVENGASSSTPSTPTPSAPPAVENVQAKPGYINGNNVRFRSAPSTSSAIISELHFGNNIVITGTSGDWTACTYNGKSGFVYSSYVKEGEYTYASTGGTATGREIADFALKFVGYNYCWGGKDPSTGFDCSGLMYYVYSQFGYTLNRVASDQARNGVHVDPADLQPGDLLCFYSSGSYIGHVGMYIGDNQFVHASTSTTGVIISELSGYYTTRGYEARRII